MLVGRVGADSISFVFIFRVYRRIQKRSHVVPGRPAIVTIVTAGEERLGKPLKGKLGKKTNGRRFDTHP